VLQEVDNRRQLTQILVHSVKPTPMSGNEASISLEGIGLISTCLKTALAKVQPSGTNSSAPTSREVDLNAFESGYVVEAFGEAVLKSQRDNAEKNLDVSLLGSGEIFYNRVGQNWRFVGEEELVLLPVPTSIEGVPEGRRIAARDTNVDHGSVDSTDRLSFSTQQTQILAYNDKKNYALSTQ
jgi:hypothetical protein